MKMNPGYVNCNLVLMTNSTRAHPHRTSNQTKKSKDR